LTDYFCPLWLAAAQTIDVAELYHWCTPTGAVWLVQSLTLLYLTLPSGWAGCYTCPAL